MNAEWFSVGFSGGFLFYGDGCLGYITCEAVAETSWSWSLLTGQLCQCRIGVWCFIRNLCDKYCVHMLYLYAKLSFFSAQTVWGTVGGGRKM